MDGTNFRLVVEEVETWKSPYAAVTCVVEGGSISVDDYVCLNHANGKTIKARVERIMVAPGLELRTAEPGKVVWLVLCGRKVKQIQRGDVLKPPAAGRSRYSKTAGVIAVILGILLIANLSNIAISLAMGWQDNISDVLRYSLVLAAVHIPMILAIDGWEFFSRWRWQQKQRREGWDADFRVLKCEPNVYQLLILPVLITALTGLILYQAAVDEPHTLLEFWNSGELTRYLLMLLIIDVLFIGCFLYYSWRKVFYSRRLLRVVSFGMPKDILWTQVCSVLLVQNKGKNRMILETAKKKIILRSDALSDGWGDFVDFTLMVARERNIPYEFTNECVRKMRDKELTREEIGK